MVRALVSYGEIDGLNPDGCALVSYVKKRAPVISGPRGFKAARHNGDLIALSFAYRPGKI